MQIQNNSIDTVDAGVDYRNISSIFIGIFLLLGVVFVKPDHRGWFVASIGALLILNGALVFFKIHRIKNSRVVSGHVSKIWLESYKIPGSAGVAPRFRVLVNLSVNHSKARQLFLPFHANNYYESMNDALLEVEKALSAPTIYYDFIFGYFVVKRIGQKVVSHAWALVAAGVLLVSLGGGIQIMI
jgi:hypothetical protein